MYKCEDPVDIAVLIPPKQLTVDYPLEANSKGMLAGQDAYFVGYPYGEFLTYPTMPDVLGFVKRATVSAFANQGTNEEILLDAINNPGFSGSPVIFRDLNQTGVVYKVAGVLVSFVFDASTVVKKQKEIQPNEITAEDKQREDVVRVLSDGKMYRVENTTELVKLNTGIATAWAIQPAVELISKHPIGPVVSDDFAPPSD